MIEVTHISKEFVSPKKYPGMKGAIKGLFSNEKVHKTAVDDISFSIGDGEIVGYIGSNGAGKSTTIKMMTGILTPSSGECLIDGINPSKDRMENAKNIGVVFGQRTQLWWDLPLSESYTILKEIYDVTDEAYQERLEFFNEVLGLKDFFDQPVRTLSLGQRMRADLGAALIHNPKVLYLDEPTIGLDLVVKDKIREAIHEINEKYNTTVILTTHDIEDIEELCSRIIIIDEGKKIYDGSLDELKDTYGSRRKVSMEVRQLAAVKKIDWESAFGAEVQDTGSSQDRGGSSQDTGSSQDRGGSSQDTGSNGDRAIRRSSEEKFRIEYLEDQNRVCAAFDKNKIHVSEIISAVMAVTEVRDIQIEETELAEIVKAIYQHGLQGGM